MNLFKIKWYNLLNNGTTIVEATNVASARIEFLEKHTNLLPTIIKIEKEVK